MDYARDVAFLNTDQCLQCAIRHEPRILSGEFPGGHRIRFRLFNDPHHQVGRTGRSLSSHGARHNYGRLFWDDDSHNS